jgi:hypothetical protein
MHGAYSAVTDQHGLLAQGLKKRLCAIRELAHSAIQQITACADLLARVTQQGINRQRLSLLRWHLTENKIERRQYICLF